MTYSREILSTDLQHVRLTRAQLEQISAGVTVEVIVTNDIPVALHTMYDENPQAQVGAVLAEIRDEDIRAMRDGRGVRIFTRGAARLPLKVSLDLDSAEPEVSVWA